MLKKIKGSSSSTKKTKIVKKSAVKAVVKGAKAVKLKKSLPVTKPSKALKASKLKNLNKATKTPKVKAAPVASAKALGTVGLQKQWARAKKTWVKSIQAEIQRTSLTLKQDIKALSIIEASVKSAPADSAVAKGKTVTAAAKAKAKKSVQAIKSQKMAAVKLQKKIGKTQKALVQLKQLLVKARAINKALSQFDKEWKVPAEVAKPKKAEKSLKATKVSKRKSAGRLAKKMTDKLALELMVSGDEKAENTTGAVLPEAA